MFYHQRARLCLTGGFASWSGFCAARSLPELGPVGLYTTRPSRPGVRALCPRLPKALGVDTFTSRAVLEKSFKAQKHILVSWKCLHLYYVCPVGNVTASNDFDFFSRTNASCELMLRGVQITCKHRPWFILSLLSVGLSKRKAVKRTYVGNNVCAAQGDGHRWLSLCSSQQEGACVWLFVSATVSVPQRRCHSSVSAVSIRVLVLETTSDVVVSYLV